MTAFFLVRLSLVAYFFWASRREGRGRLPPFFAVTEVMPAPQPAHRCRCRLRAHPTNPLTAWYHPLHHATNSMYVFSNSTSSPYYTSRWRLGQTACTRRQAAPTGCARRAEKHSWVSSRRRRFNKGLTLAYNYFSTVP